MQMATASLLTCLLLTCSVLPSSAQRSSELVQEDITSPSGSRGVMVRPRGSGPYPAVLHLHGSGDTVAKNVEILQLFARAGYVALDIEYRQVKPGSIDINDIYQSLEVLSSSPHVRRGVIGLNGFSLGGRMALRVAANRKVLAVSAIAARTTAGSTPTVLDEAARLDSPILLQHGLDDPVVPHEDAVLLEKRLRGLGRRVELISYPGGGHNNLPWNEVYAKVLTFFSTHLR